MGSCYEQRLIQPDPAAEVLDVDEVLLLGVLEGELPVGRGQQATPGFPYPAQDIGRLGENMRFAASNF